MELFKNRFSNSFDFLRLAGAVGVIYLHSYHLLKQQHAVALDQLFQHRINLTVIMLGIFFTVSGFLIARSVETSVSLKNYIWKRMLRVQPLLTVVCLLTVFLIGPLFTETGVGNYFRNRDSWMYLRTILPVFGIQFHLPGVFEHNTGESGVNGSLWTLIIEERVYLAMCLLFYVQRSRTTIFMLFVAILNILYLVNFFKWGGLNIPWLDKYEAQYFLLFFNGALVYFLKIPLHRINTVTGILIVAAIYYLTRNTVWSTLFVLPLLILLIGSRKTIVSAIAKKGDITYGLYVLSFPVQQMLIYLSENTIRPPVLFLCTLSVCIPLAYLSWHFLEKKILRLRNRIR
ncbi:acyltransferase family protein [Niabella beijingensis]|uniref:acyltransferase family protein n=1 Tax=Niabella beijingensis TaxID=2872700 RepID=UPI001CBC5C92|nr:acyltransferase [Niabella beijingensis]MBZ4192101.1 acyltransferase [Niabella beijingensis]